MIHAMIYSAFYHYYRVRMLTGVAALNLWIAVLTLALQVVNIWLVIKTRNRE